MEVAEGAVWAARRIGARVKVYWCEVSPVRSGAKRAGCVAGGGIDLRQGAPTGGSL